MPRSITFNSIQLFFNVWNSFRTVMKTKHNRRTKEINKKLNRTPNFTWFGQLCLRPRSCRDFTNFCRYCIQCNKLWMQGWLIQWITMKFWKSGWYPVLLSGVFVGNVLFYSAFHWIFLAFWGVNFKGGVQDLFQGWFGLA